MTALKTVDVDEVRSRLGLPPNVPDSTPAFAASGANPVDRARTRLRRRVALLGSFDPSTLVSWDDARPRAEVAAFLASDCEPVTTPAGPAWRVTSAVRQRTIRETGLAGLPGLVRAGRTVSGP
jgi:hypothetical protein